jgi:hypothetical protein
MNRFIIYLAIAFTFCGVDWMAAEEPSLKPDPIAGEWRWNGNRDVLVDPDGTATHSSGAKAKWKLLHNSTTAERKYEFSWKKPDGTISIDIIILSGDGNRLDGRSQSNRRISAKRIP